MWLEWCVQAVDCEANSFWGHARPDESFAEVSLHVFAASLIEKVAIVDRYKMCHALSARSLRVVVVLAEPCDNLSGSLSHVH